MLDPGTSDATLNEAAYHEAGHIVVALQHGLSVPETWLRPSKQIDRWGGETSITWLSSHAPSEPLIKTILAGPAAQCVHCLLDKWDGQSALPEFNRFPLSYISGHGLGGLGYVQWQRDLRDFRHHLTLKESGPLGAALFNAALCHAITHVCQPHVWGRIEAIGSELGERKIMRDDEIGQILTSASVSADPRIAAVEIVTRAWVRNLIF